MYVVTKGKHQKLILAYRMRATLAHRKCSITRYHYSLERQLALEQMAWLPCYRG